MRIELLDGAGVVLRVIDDIPGAGAMGKVMPYYPDAVSWREVDPATAAAQDAARMAEERLQNAAVRAILRILRLYFEGSLDQENRILKLEGRPPVTVAQHFAGLRGLSAVTDDQFKAAMRQMLGV